MLGGTSMGPIAGGVDGDDDDDGRIHLHKVGARI